MPIKTQSGFAMLEVLVSMVVIMIGVLGIAGMQMLAIGNTENARYQSIAAILASGLVAQIQANPGYWSSASTPTALITVAGTTLTNGPTSGGTCHNTVCTASSLAAYDLKNWGAAMANVANIDGVTYNGTVLPSGSGTIQCVKTHATATVAAAPTVCTINLTWMEKNTAISNAAGTETGTLATGTVNQHNYQTITSIPVWSSPCTPP